MESLRDDLSIDGIICRTQKGASLTNIFLENEFDMMLSEPLRWPKKQHWSLSVIASIFPKQHDVHDLWIMSGNDEFPEDGRWVIHDTRQCQSLNDYSLLDKFVFLALSCHISNGRVPGLSYLVEQAGLHEDPNYDEEAAEIYWDYNEYLKRIKERKKRWLKYQKMGGTNGRSYI